MLGSGSILVSGSIFWIAFFVEIRTVQQPHTVMASPGHFHLLLDLLQDFLNGSGEKSIVRTGTTDGQTLAVKMAPESPLIRYQLIR